MFGVIVAATLAASAPQTTAQLIAEIRKLDTACQDGDGSTEAAMNATLRLCARREPLMRQLEARGLCWGPDEASEADRHWMKVGRTCHN